jgi:hypothetical protein
MPDISRPCTATYPHDRLVQGCSGRCSESATRSNACSCVQPEDVARPDAPEREYVSRYASRALAKAERNVFPTKTEYFALFWSTKKFDKPS